MAANALQSNKGRQNFQRLTRLLIAGATTIGRETFDAIHPPATLTTVFADPSHEAILRRARMTRPQLQQVYPSPGIYGKSEDWDLTLLHKMLRNICGLTQPATGWDDLPPDSDLSKEADLVRLKYYRNSVYGHVDERMQIKDEEFQKLWKGISEAIIRLAGHLSSGKKKEWEDSIEDFLTAPLTSDERLNIEELKSWYRQDVELREEFIKLNVGVEELKSQKAAINISHVYGNIVVGDYCHSNLVYKAEVPACEKIGQPRTQSTNDNKPYVRPGSDVCHDGEHTNKDTGLVCHSCGVTRRNTTDCTHNGKRPQLEPRPKSDLNGHLYHRPRTQQIRRAAPKRENRSYGDVYTSGSITGPWSPAPNNRITNYPPKQTHWKNWEEFVQNVDKHLEELPKVTKEAKRLTEQFLLHVVLPNLERSTSSDTAVILAKLGSAGVGNSITTHALELLFELVSHNKLNRHADKLQEIERIIRHSVVSTNGAFDREMLHQQERRLVLYSRLLILSLIEKAVNGNISFSVEDEKELREGVVAKLEKLFAARQVYKKKPHLKLAIEVISEAIERLFSTISSVREQHEAFIQEFTPFLDPLLAQMKAEKKWKTLQKQLCNTNNVWFDVVMLLHYINTQEKMYPTKTVIMLCRLVDGYMMIPEGRRMFKTIKHHKHNGPFLAALSVLFRIGMTQKDKNVRKDAAMSLVKYMTPTCGKPSSSPLGAVDEIKRYMGMFLFGRDPDTRTLLAYHLFDTHNHDQEIPQQYMEQYLEWVYRKHSLEMNGHSVNGTDSCHFTRGGRFRGIPSVVKILKLKVREISQPGTVASSKDQRYLINEAYCLNKLNANPHPNILRLLAFNTAKPPYHVITEYMSKGTVREHLQSFWLESDSLPSQSTLIKTCQDVVEAARFLSSLHFVHRGLTADNVFIGEDGVCKVAGTATVQPLSYRGRMSEANKEDTYLTPTDIPPEYLSKDEDYPVTHAAPECIKKGTFSTASDVYGIGVFMWEVFTNGCPAYSRTEDGICILENAAKIKQYILDGTKLPKEDCFHEKIYSLMESCWMTDPAERPSLDHLLKELGRLHSAYIGTEYERPPATPPCSRSAVKLNRLPSPRYSPELEQDQAEFPTSHSSDPTTTDRTAEEPLYDNGTTAGYPPCRQQEMNAGSCGYMPLIQRHGGEYESRQLSPSKNTKRIPGSNGGPFLLRKPPAPRNNGSLVVSNTRKAESKDTVIQRSSPLLSSSQTRPLKKTSEMSTAGENEANHNESTSNLHQRMQSSGKRVFPEQFKPPLSGLGFTTVGLCGDIGTQATNATTCQVQETFVSRPVPTDSTDREEEESEAEDLYEEVGDADIAVLRLKTIDPSSQYMGLSPGACYSDAATNTNVAGPVQLSDSGTEDNELTEDDLRTGAGYYDNVCEGESYYEPIWNKDNDYDDVMPEVQRRGADNGFADYVISPHCAWATEETAVIHRPDSGFGSQDTEDIEIYDGARGADISVDDHTYVDMEKINY